MEHIQLLALLYVSFSKEAKVDLLQQCFSTIERISKDTAEDSPLRVYRLVVIIEYMFRGFSQVPQQLFQQVLLVLLVNRLVLKDKSEADRVIVKNQHY